MTLATFDEIENYLNEKREEIELNKQEKKLGALFILGAAICMLNICATIFTRNSASLKIALLSTIPLAMVVYTLYYKHCFCKWL